MFTLLLQSMLSLLPNMLFLVSYVSGSGSFQKPLTAEEEKRYLEQYKAGDTEAKNILIERNLRLVAHIVKKYAGQNNDTDDLISIGTIGLIKGITTFNPQRGTRLATYAAKCIEKTIRSQRLFLNKKREFQPPNSEAGIFYGKSTAIYMFSIAIGQTEQFSCQCISILSDC